MAVQYNTVQYSTVARYGHMAVWLDVINWMDLESWADVRQQTGDTHYTVQYSTVQYSTVQYSTVQYSTVQYSTVQYSTVQYSIVLYTVQYTGTHYTAICWSLVINPYVLTWCSSLHTLSHKCTCMLMYACVLWMYMRMCIRGIHTLANRAKLKYNYWLPP